MFCPNCFWVILLLCFRIVYCDEEPPRLQQITALDALREGQRFRVACNVISGSMPLQISWYKDDSPLENSDLIQIRNLSEELSELIINSVSLNDSGKYSCIAKNSNGTDVSNVKVEIQGKKINNKTFYI